MRYRWWRVMRLVYQGQVNWVRMKPSRVREVNVRCSIQFILAEASRYALAIPDLLPPTRTLSPSRKLGPPPGS